VRAAPAESLIRISPVSVIARSTFNSRICGASSSVVISSVRPTGSARTGAMDRAMAETEASNAPGAALTMRPFNFKSRPPWTFCVRELREESFIKCPVGNAPRKRVLAVNFFVGGGHCNEINGVRLHIDLALPFLR
jgi:hypothetical protein